MQCAWKGCRAPALSQRARQLSEDFLALRDTDAAQEVCATHAGVTRMLAVHHLKFAWVDDLPFFIWQARSLATAVAFLAKFATSPPPHQRVTLDFAHGELRQDMGAWAAGGLPSARFRLEVLSYRWCKLDDTWAEATHRDVSRLAKRSTFARQAWLSASLRLQQNLSLWDSLDTQARVRFDSMFLPMEKLLAS